MNASKSAPSYNLRAARAEDSAAIARLSTQLGYPVTAERISARIANALRDPSSAVVVAETPSGEVVGFVHLLHQFLIESDPRVEIGALVVDETHRGAGVGRTLMARAEKWARGRGCHCVNLRSNVIRAGAHAFYERIGYRHYKTQKGFRKDF
jgi:GNAT superfamily N-acetyltransferase